MTRRTRIEQLRAKAKRQDPSKGVSSGPGGQQPPGQQAPGTGSDEPGMSDAPGANPTDGQGTQPTGPPGQGSTPPGGDQGANPSDQPGQGDSGSPTVTAPPGSNSSQGPGTSSTALPGGGNGNGSGSGNGSGNGNGGGTGNGNGTGPSSTPGIPGSGSGTVSGPGSGRHGLTPAAITAILLSVLLVLAILALAVRLLWRRYRERHRVGLRAFHRPQLYTQSSYQQDPQMAERLRGGLIDPYTGAASASTLSSQYRIEPFAVPPGRPLHTRASSSTRLLDDPAVMAIARDEKRGPSPLPRGAMNLAHHGHTFSEVEGTPLPSPGSEEEMVFELPPTYASLNQPQPMRPWYRFWQSPS